MTDGDSKTLLDALIDAIETVLSSFTGLSTERYVALDGYIGVSLANEFGA